MASMTKLIIVTDCCGVNMLWCQHVVVFVSSDHLTEHTPVNTTECTLELSDTIVLAIYRDILKVSISRYFVINYHDTMPVHYCH